jgi:GAF domain-containing protein
MGVRAWAGYPVRSADGHVLGSFCVVDTTPRSFTPDGLLLLETLADSASREVTLRAALALERERTAEHERHRAQLDDNLRKLQALNVAASEMARLDSLEDVLACCTRSAVEIIGARQGVTSLTRGRDWSQAIASVSLGDGYRQWQEYATPPDGSGIYALVCDTNTPLRLTQAELEAHPRWRGFGEHAAEHPPMHGWLAAPLIDRTGSNLGLIQLSDKRVGASDGAPQSDDDRREFDEADLALLVQLADWPASRWRRPRPTSTTTRSPSSCSAACCRPRCPTCPASPPGRATCPGRTTRPSEVTSTSSSTSATDGSERSSVTSWATGCAPPR